MRALDRVMVLVVGLALLGGGGLLVAEVIQDAAGVDPWVDWHGWLQTLRDTRFDDDVPMAAFAGSVALGALLLAVLLRRRTPTRVAVQDDAGSGRWWLRRRGLEHYLGWTLVRRTPTRKASVRMRPRRRLVARIAPYQGHPAADVEEHLEQVIERMGVRERMRIRVEHAPSGRP